MIQMTTEDTLSNADRIAMLVGGGLIILGTAVLGFVNTVTGSPHMPVVEEGEVVATPLVAPEVRAVLVALGLLVWLLFAIYKVTTAPGRIHREDPRPIVS